MKFQFVRLHDEENNSAFSSDSEDPEKSQHLLNIEERRKHNNFFSGALRRNRLWKNSSRSREENQVRGESRYGSENSRSGQSQQPIVFLSKNQSGPTMSFRYKSQNNQKRLNNCIGPDGHYNNGITTTYIMAFRDCQFLRQT